MDRPDPPRGARRMRCHLRRLYDTSLVLSVSTSSAPVCELGRLPLEGKAILPALSALNVSRYSLLVHSIAQPLTKGKQNAVLKVRFMGQCFSYTGLRKQVDCKSEGHVLRAKTSVRGDVHFCKRAGIK